MDATIKTGLWLQFGAAIDTLENAVRACPAELWRERLWDHPSEPPGYAEYWYIAYHTLFWLDFYLSGGEEGFSPPAPYTLSELEPAGFPDRVYSRDELLSYLDYGRRKCRASIEALDGETAGRNCRFPWGEVSFYELLLYNLRHVQEHAAQLSLFLGQKTAPPPPGWVIKAKSSPD